MEHAAVILKTLREKLGFNQETIANFLGTKREMVSYYETGAREIPLDALEKLADLFGVDLAIFFADSLEEASIDISFAFRADELGSEDIESIAAFRKIIKNYHRITNLGGDNV
ncbi:helix-turn-helix domain-containing protein [Chitinophaga sp. Hz27]|uniref:helix-turn-helix domain-containing protein n=1 Tax=Chitinophaga sp. Hz27 TaxID=3347169 RepID=UPI0035DC935B